MQPPHWLRLAREIQAIAQIGRTYAENHFQSERYDRLMEIAAEIFAQHSKLSVEDTLEAFGEQIGYATPKVDVRGAVFREGEILLVRDRSDDRWCMPGGWADVGDMPSKAVEREVLEESGFHVQAKRVVGVYDANRNGPLRVFHAFKIVFLCSIIKGKAKPSLETSEVSFFSHEHIPQSLSFARTNNRHIKDAFSALEDVRYRTAFD